jgi:hypothetical protein
MQPLPRPAPPAIIIAAGRSWLLELLLLLLPPPPASPASPHPMRALAILALVAAADAHGAVVHPPPRNAVDRDLAPWNAPMPNHLPPVEGSLCPAPDANGKITGELGQACFWFSNGCTIGCEQCDGISRGPIIHGIGRPSPYNRGWARKFNTCNETVNSTATPTICDERLRTVNTNATCMGAGDFFQYSPWRAPGSAPVFDPCGMAGGHVWPQGGFGGQYKNTTHAKIGDKGSEVLPASAPTVEWKAGSVVEVSWSVMANHGGVSLPHPHPPAQSAEGSRCTGVPVSSCPGGRAF